MSYLKLFDKLFCSIGIILVICINSFLALPIFVLKVLKKEKISLYLGIFFATLGYYLRLEDECDIMRYYKIFNENFEIRKIFLANQTDIYAKSVIEFLIYYNLPKFLLGAFSAFITYYYLFKSLELILKKKQSKYNNCYYILTFFTVSLIGFSGIRFYPAMILMTYSILNKYIENSRKWIIYGVASCLIHSSMIAIFIILIITEILINKLNFELFKKLIYLSFIIGVILNEKVSLFLINEINKIGYIYISPDYIIGKWGTQYIQQLNLTGRIVEGIIIQNFMKISILLYIYTCNKSNLNYFLGSLCSIFLMTYRYHTISTRYFSIISLVIYYILLRNRNKKNMLVFYIIIGLGFLRNLIDIKAYYSYFFISYYEIYKISLINIFLEILKNKH